jgi:hypothetical protein
VPARRLNPRFLHAVRRAASQVMPLVENKNRDEILSAVRDYAYRLRAAGENAVGFLYYSGHGFAVGEHNYLLPVDLISTSAKTVEVKGLRLQELIDILEEKTPKAAHFVIFDACRSELQGPGARKASAPCLQGRAWLSRSRRPPAPPPPMVSGAIQAGPMRQRLPRNSNETANIIWIFSRM